MEWDLHLSYGKTKFVQKATVEYSSNQIIRIRVTGKHGSLLLENNQPVILFANSRRGVKWKIREGKMKDGSLETAALLRNIFAQLEHYIKQDFYKIYPDAVSLFSPEPTETHQQYLMRTKR